MEIAKQVYIRAKQGHGEALPSAATQEMSTEYHITHQQVLS